MHATLTTTRGDVADLPLLAVMAGETMVEWLRDIEGFVGIVMLNNEAAGRVQVISFWESEEVADRHMAARLKLRERITSTVNVEVEESESYDVSFADLPALREPTS
jgi:hypothetical protein